MGLFLGPPPSTRAVLIMAGMFTARKKIQKENGAEPDELEDAVAQAMFDLEANAHDLKVDLHDLFFLSAKEYDVAGGKKAITITVPYRLLKAYHKNQVQQWRRERSSRRPSGRQRAPPSVARAAGRSLLCTMPSSRTLCSRLRLLASVPACASMAPSKPACTWTRRTRPTLRTSLRALLPFTRSLPERMPFSTSP